MANLTAAALTVLQRQVGHITSAQFAHAGIGREARRAMVNNGVLEHPYKFVYRTATRVPTFEQRLVALSLAHPAGFVTGPTAGAYLGLRKMPKSSAIHLCVPHGSPTAVDVGVKLRQSTRISMADRRALDNGMTVASWARLNFDLASDLPPVALSSVVDQVVQKGFCTLDDLGAMARRLCHPMRPGSLPFARAMLARGNRAAVDSHPELVVLEGLLARDVPVRPQHEGLRLPNGRSIRIDIAVPAARWAVEVDVHPSHLDLVGATRDRQRDRQLHLIDWQVERVTEIDLLDPEGLFDELAGLYHHRVRRSAA